MSSSNQEFNIREFLQQYGEVRNFVIKIQSDSQGICVFADIYEAGMLLDDWVKLYAEWLQRLNRPLERHEEDEKEINFGILGWDLLLPLLGDDQIDLFEEYFGGPEQHPELLLQYLMAGHVERVESSPTWGQFEDRVLELRVAQWGMATNAPVQSGRRREGVILDHGPRQRMRITADEFLQLCALFRYHGMVGSSASMVDFYQQLKKRCDLIKQNIDGSPEHIIVWGELRSEAEIVRDMLIRLGGISPDAIEVSSIEGETGYQIEIPRLYDRKEDIPQLVNHRFQHKWPDSELRDYQFPIAHWLMDQVYGKKMAMQDFYDQLFSLVSDGSKLHFETLRTESLEWSQVVIERVSKDSIKVRGGGSEQTYLFNTLGFTDGRKKDLPNTRWKLLQDLLSNEGVVTDNDLSEPVKDLKKAISDLRIQLQCSLPYTGNPIKYDEENKVYKSVFTSVDRAPKLKRR